MTDTSAPDPSTPSSAYGRMLDAWTTIGDILAGPAAIRSKGERYLPKHEGESDAEYKRRLKQAPWQSEFEDILRSLASRPFDSEVTLGDGASERIKAVYEDVDLRGDNLTAFSRGVFECGIAKGYHVILVEYPRVPGGTTLADERQSGARPYWVSIEADDVLALYTAFVGGREIVAHIRIRECSVERDGFGEKATERVRVLEREPIVGADGKITGYGPPKWYLWEAQEGAAGAQKTWSIVDSGAMVPQDEIPAVVFWTGEREGSHYVRPPLAALADKQIELYRDLARQDDILTKAAFPMLTANGLAAPGNGERVVTGPGRILYAPGGQGYQTSWDYIQPDAALVTEIREGVKATEETLRRLGMQPLTQKAGGYTATAASIEGAKAHSVVEAWAVALKDVLEQAFVFTAKWIGEDPNIEVEVDTDFSVEPYAQAPLDALGKARQAGDLSRRTYWQSLRRFDVLPPDFDAEDEEIKLEEEGPALGTIGQPPNVGPIADPQIAD